MGIRGVFRPLLREYYRECKGIIFVVDSNDWDRLDQTRDEFMRLLAEDNLKNVPILVFVNKQDIPGAMSFEDITEKLDCKTRSSELIHYEACCGKSGDGIFTGFEWLRKATTEKLKSTSFLGVLSAKLNNN